MPYYPHTKSNPYSEDPIQRKPYEDFFAKVQNEMISQPFTCPIQKREVFVPGSAMVEFCPEFTYFVKYLSEVMQENPGYDFKYYLRQTIIRFFANRPHMRNEYFSFFISSFTVVLLSCDHGPSKYLPCAFSSLAEIPFISESSFSLYNDRICTPVWEILRAMKTNFRSANNAHFAYNCFVIKNMMDEFVQSHILQYPYVPRHKVSDLSDLALDILQDLVSEGQVSL